jgi:hypothetical protein
MDAAELALSPPLFGGQERVGALRRSYPDLHAALSTVRVVGEP